MKLLWFAAGLGLMLQPGAPAATRTIPIVIRYSHFTPSTIEVASGTTVRFDLHNADPIPHEFILGNAAEHAAHEQGVARTHDGFPGQESLDIGERAMVSWTFTTPGTVAFACHLPGHFAFGMAGIVKVRP